MQLDKYQDVKSRQKNPDINWMLQASVEEILEKALDEDWDAGAFEKWLRVKEIQFLEKIAFSKFIERK